MLLGPFVGALIGATTVTLFADPAAPWIEILGRWWLGDGLGVLVVATPILAFSRRDRRTPLLSTLELALILGVAVAVLVVPALLWHHPMIYAVLPVLLWAAFRGGTFAVSVTGVGIALAANWVAVSGRVGDLVVGQKSEQLLFLQIYLAIILLSALAVAIEVEERHRLERHTKRAERDRIVAEQRTAEVELHERSRLASETHDIVGHGLNVMLLQAGAARRLLPADPEQARLLLTSLEEVGRRACRDLDVVLAAERASPASEDRGLSAVPGLVTLLREAGLHIELTMNVPAGSLPTVVDRSAYRVVREALTNVAKHAPRKAAHSSTGSTA